MTYSYAKEVKHFRKEPYNFAEKPLLFGHKKRYIFAEKLF